MHFKIEVQMRPTENPVVTKFSQDPGGLRAYFDKALQECGTNRHPIYYIKVVVDRLFGDAPGASWEITFVDLGGQIWVSNFLQPDVSVVEDPMVTRKNRYEREPVI